MKFMILMTLFFSFSATAASKKNIEFNKVDVEKFLTNYSDLVLKNYEATYAKTLELQKEINFFISSPSEANLEKAKNAWISARQEYSKTEAYRFYGGPIDAAETGPEGLINSWPLDESYIDYVKGNLNSGIINLKEKYPTINKELLISLNEKDGEVNIATGYHAIEFLLWGQDLKLGSSGKRSFEDYLITKNSNADRRSLYLKIVTELLLENLETVKKQWENGNYLAALKKESPKNSVQKIMLGLTTLTYDEMSGERMTVAFEKKDQENEQDCFSDNSLNDLAANQEGIIEVFENTGLNNLFSNKAMIFKISNKLKENLETIKLIKAPFDMIVSDKKHPERSKIKKFIAELQVQARLLNKLGKEYGLELNVQ